MDSILACFGTKFGPHKIFSWILSLLDGRHGCKLSFYVMINTNESIWRKWLRTQFWTWFWPIWPKFEVPKFVFKNLAPSVTRCHDQLSSCPTSEKSNDSILRKLSDRPTDGHTDSRKRVILQDAVRLTSSVQIIDCAFFVTM